jgi:hypothetical protein
MKKILASAVIVGLASITATSHAEGWGFDSLKQLVPVSKKAEEDVAKRDATDTGKSADIGAMESGKVTRSADRTKKEIAEADAKAEADKKMETLVNRNEQIIRRYVQAVLRLAEAQIQFAEALDEKEQADLLRAESKALQEGNYADKDAIKRHAKVSEKTNRVISKKLEKQDELTAEGRKQFSHGLLQYAIGLRETKEMIDEIGPFYASVKQQVNHMSASVPKDTSFKDRSIAAIGVAVGKGISFVKQGKELYNGKFGTAAYLATKGPQFMDDHRKTATKVVDYAKSNDLEVPKDMENTLSFI